MTEDSNNKAIIVLGYSLNEDCSLHPLLRTRLNKAYTLYKSGIPIIVSGARPAAQSKGCKISEAEVMRQYLVQKGVSDADIFLEELSLTTFMNAFYTLVLHLNPMSIKNAYVVSNEFHMPLVKYCFNLIYGNHVKVEFVAALSPDRFKELVKNKASRYLRRK